MICQKVDKRYVSFPGEWRYLEHEIVQQMDPCTSHHHIAIGITDGQYADELRDMHGHGDPNVDQHDDDLGIHTLL